MGKGPVLPLARWLHHWLKVSKFNSRLKGRIATAEAEITKNQSSQTKSVLKTSGKAVFAHTSRG